MQEGTRRSQKDRSEAMRAALVASARDLFARDGFAATATPDVVSRAGVTRGALYHHFHGKEDLFDAVIQSESRAVAADIAALDYSKLSPRDALLLGGEAFLAAMRVDGRTRLLLVEAPAVLSPARLAEIDVETGGRTLHEGLLAASVEPAAPLAALLSAAFDRAALAIDQGEPADPWKAALRRLIVGLVG